MLKSLSMPCLIFVLIPNLDSWKQSTVLVLIVTDKQLIIEITDVVLFLALYNEPNALTTATAHKC